jgi:hypothetical protein
MRIKKIDMWKEATDGDWICITTNGTIAKSGRCVMGAGCALEARKKIKGIDIVLGELVKLNGPITQLIMDDYNGVSIISFPTKYNWYEKSDIGLIVSNAIQLKKMLNSATIKPKNIYIPKPGCGYGGLMWSEVKPIIEEILDNDIFCIVYK